jgi:hypothetical protein
MPHPRTRRPRSQDTVTAPPLHEALTSLTSVIDESHGDGWVEDMLRLLAHARFLRDPRAERCNIMRHDETTACAQSRRSEA